MIRWHDLRLTRVVMTFLEVNDLSGKTVISFCLSEFIGKDAQNDFPTTQFVETTRRAVEEASKLTQRFF